MESSGSVENHWWTGQEWLAGVAILIVGGGLAAYFGIRKSWEVGEWLAAVGVVISLAGFTTALLEIRKTQHATRATREAVHQTLLGVAASRLGIDIVQMRRLADEFEEAANPPQNSDAARRSLTEWRHLASEAKALVQQRFGEKHEALALLAASVETARNTKATIFDRGMSAEDIKGCLSAMEKALDDLGPLLEQLYPAIDDSQKAVK